MLHPLAFLCFYFKTTAKLGHQKSHIWCTWHVKCRWNQNQNQKPGQARDWPSIPNHEKILGDLWAVIDPLGNLIQTLNPFPETHTQNVVYSVEVSVGLPFPPPKSFTTA